MNLKTLIPLCLSLVVGVIVAKIAYNQIQQNKTGGPVDSKTTQIVVAKDSIGAGEELLPEKLMMGKVATDSVPQGSFTSIDQLKGRVAQVVLHKSQAIADNFLAPEGTGSGLQFAIPKGMRAITIEVNEFSGVGGMLTPGSHVDLLSTLPAEQGGEMISRTVVQNVQIIAVGQRMISQPDKKGDEPQVFRSVTMLATPAEAEAIELAAVTGRPRLVLRAGSDKDYTETAGVTSSHLRGHQAIRKSDAASAPAPVYSTVKVIRGTIETEVRFDGQWMSALNANKLFNGNPSTQPANPGNNTNVTKTETNAVSGD